MSEMAPEGTIDVEYDRKPGIPEPRAEDLIDTGPPVWLGCGCLAQTDRDHITGERRIVCGCGRGYVLRAVPQGVRYEVRPIAIPGMNPDGSMIDDG